MVYIQRDERGQILQVDDEPFTGMNDTLALQSVELQEWLQAKEEVTARLAKLRASDLELVRVLEDVVAVLVEQGTLKYTDLPHAARAKLDQRAIERADIEGMRNVEGL